METILNKKILNKVRELITKKCVAIRVQKEYARADESVIYALHQMTRPFEEKGYSHLRNLARYIGENTANMVMKTKRNLTSQNRMIVCHN